MRMELEDRVVIVTGGAKGIGAATVRAFADEGASVLIVDRDRSAGETLAGEVGGSRAVIFHEADLADIDACRAAVELAQERLGGIDVLVNNAGFNDALGLDADPARFMESVTVNLQHVYAMTHYALPALRRSRGVVVNLGSKVAFTGQGHTSGYAAAKGAISALTREWAVALAGDGIRVNCVLPAECLTDQYERWFESCPDPAAARRQVEELVPLGNRLTTAREIADAVLFLASPRSGHTTGQWIFVDGGYTHLDRAATQISGHKWS